MQLSWWATGNKTDFHNDLYHAKDSIDESKATYICISCQPFFLRSVKIQNEYEKAQALFEETQKCSNTSSWSDPIIEATPQTGSFASTQMPAEPDTKFELPLISNLKVGIFTKGLQQLLEDQRPTKNDLTPVKHGYILERHPMKKQKRSKPAKDPPRELKISVRDEATEDLSFEQSPEIK